MRPVLRANSPVAWLAAATYLIALSVFALSNAGRIDSIDGQYRYEVAANLLETGKPEMRDPVLVPLGYPGLDGLTYSGCGPAPSYLALPLVATGAALGDVDAELSRFLFSFLNAFFAAGTVALLLVFFVELGVGARRAVSWAFVTAFGTMLWVGATTVLEQGQHTFFALLSIYLAWRAGRDRSWRFAALGGLAGGSLTLYQMPYAMHQIFLAIPTLSEAGIARDSGRARSIGRFLCFGVGASIPIATAVLYNLNRFGALLWNPTANMGDHPPLAGNPLVGVPTLLFSPGKGVLLYSPVFVLGLVGLFRLAKREKRLVSAVLLFAAFHLVFIGSLSFFHGDWCWGPRYLLVFLPLLSVGLPFALEGVGPVSRKAASAVVALGIVANLLGLALVHERFFFEKGLPTYFWKDNAAFYWKNSAYFHRFGELAELIRSGVPPEAVEFASSLYPGLLTYFLVPAGPPEDGATWMKFYRVYSRPRPWPLWLYFEREGWARGRGFPGYWLWVGGVAGIGLAGAWLLRSTLRRLPRESLAG